MMPKKDAPGEPAENGKRGIAINLPPEQEAQVRKLSAKTGLSLRELRTALETSAGVAEAITAELKRRHNLWLDAQAKAGDIFAPEKEGESRG